MVLEELLQLAEEYALWFSLLALFSIVTVVAMATLGARVLAHLPEDYFLNPERRAEHRYLQLFPSWLRPLVPILKNLLGLLLALLGIAMLVLPGQGLLTLLAGLMLMDFPGKFHCEQWLVRRKQVRASINWLRKRSGESPLKLD